MAGIALSLPLSFRMKLRAQLAPQINTHNGTPSVVVVSADEWQKKTHARDHCFLLASPLHGADLSVERETDEQRVCRDKAAPRYYVVAGTAPIEASCGHQINSVSQYCSEANRRLHGIKHPSPPARWSTII